MPLFEYVCRECGHRFETLVVGGRKPACPSCTSDDLEKLYSAFGARTSAGGSGAAAPRFT
jgi:putative FmdB family regulatory protein